MDPSPRKPSPRAASALAALAAAPPPPAVVAGSARARRRRRLRREAARVAIGLGIAVALHLAALAWLASIAVEPDAGPRRVSVAASTAEAHLAAPPPEPPEPVPLEPPVESLPEVTLPSAADARPGPIGEAGMLGLGGGGLGRGPLGRAPTLRDDGRLESAFRRFLDEMRRRGLDVVFVIDATASMNAFLELARATVGEIIADLTAVVPDLRLGLVAYRDRGDEWVTQHVPLTYDRYAIRNFLANLEARGGGDAEEAVEAGFAVAADAVGWRDGARRVIILVGDAPAHAEDERGLLSDVRAFSRGEHALVNVLYTGVDPARPPTERQKETRAALARIASAGGGLLADLSSGDPQLRRRITDATFGPEWAEDVAELLGDAEPGTDWQDRIVRQRVASGDVRWLVRNLGREPVRPPVVEGCLELFDRAVATGALAILLDEREPTPVRSAALYVLERGLELTTGIDVFEALAEQGEAMTRLRRAVDRLPGVAPPPR